MSSDEKPCEVMVTVCVLPARHTPPLSAVRVKLGAGKCVRIKVSIRTNARMHFFADKQARIKCHAHTHAQLHTHKRIMMAYKIGLHY